MRAPYLHPIVAQLPATVPFVGPETLERRSGRPFRARLGANESGFGPSPKVKAAIRDAAEGVWTYGDPENYALRHALANHLGTPIDTIMVGEGIDALLGLTCRLYLQEGDRVVTSLGAYPTFNYHVAAQGAQLATVPYIEDRESLAALLEATQAAPPRIVYLANPDNPMGTWWDAEAISEFVTAVPEQTLIVLDEAYGETAPPGTLPPLAISRPNLLRFRTFSKAYGLAGMRVGYVIGSPEPIVAFDRIRNHFGVNKLAQIAACAALADQTYLGEAVARIVAARDTIATFATELGLVPLPSATNFVTIDCGRDAAYATAILDGLTAHSIFVRKPMAPVLDRCIRMSTGKAEDLALASQALAEVIATLQVG